MKKYKYRKAKKEKYLCYSDAFCEYFEVGEKTLRKLEAINDQNVRFNLYCGKPVLCFKKITFKIARKLGLDIALIHLGIEAGVVVLGS